LADGGTLFLDEVATVAPQTQVRLLRVLQERELERVGGEETIRVDVRVIAATNQSPQALLEGTGFREDLFYRLHVVPLTLPPLRERRSDIPVLARHFVAKLRERTCSPASSITEAAVDQLVSHLWPGNVRELENVIERALVLADGTELDTEDLPTFESFTTMGEGAATGPNLSPDGMDLNQIVEGMEERLLRQALEQSAGVKAEAARLLGLKPSALYYKLEKYGIEA
jgi:two-component system response regulator HydG